MTFAVVAKASPLVSKDDRVYLIGDSLGYLLMQEMPSIAKNYEVVFDGKVVPGSSIIQWTIGLKDELAQARAFRPNTVLVCLGANDSYMGTRIIANEVRFLDRLLRKLRRNNTQVVWIGPPKLIRKPLELQAFYNMTSAKSIYMDSRAIDINMWDDDLHPSESGRKVWAQWIWQQLTIDPSI